MDFNALVEQIALRVSQVIEAQESTTCDSNLSCVPKSKILVLTTDNSEHCNRMLNNSAINEKYNTLCSICEEKSSNPEDFEAVVVYNFTNDVLAKVSSGMCDTKFTKLISNFILLGKKVYVITEDIELFKYKQTAPKCYYEMMLEKLNFLSASGVEFCNENQLEDLLCGSCNVEKKTTTRDKSTKEIALNKKVITERDVIAAKNDDAGFIVINKNSIITDLAKDLLHKHKIEVLRK